MGQNIDGGMGVDAVVAFRRAFVKKSARCRTVRGPIQTTPSHAFDRRTAPLMIPTIE